MSVRPVTAGVCVLLLAGCGNDDERLPQTTTTRTAAAERTSTPVPKDRERDMNVRVRRGLELEGHRVKDIDCTQDTRTTGVCLVDFRTKDGPLRMSVDVKIDRSKKRYDWKLVLPPKSDVDSPG